MAWLRLTITSRPSCLDELTELLERFTAVSVSYSAGTAEAIFGDDAPADEYWEQTAVSALFPPDIDTDILIACVRNQLGSENLLDHSVELIEDESWDDVHKTALSPMVFGGKLCICPGWLTPPADIPYVVALAPGLAFGSGSHATTSLCLEWLADNDMIGKRVIDYGCGSGILALAAARLGASSVVAVDIDPQALQATAANAGKNRLETRILAIDPGDDRLQTADILVANILKNPLLRLSASFASLLDEGGNIVLSGILANQAEECMRIYSRWFDLNRPVYRDEWTMLSGVRNREI